MRDDPGHQCRGLVVHSHAWTLLQAAVARAFAPRFACELAFTCDSSNLGGSAMLKRLAVFALLCSVSLLMEACGSGTGTGTGTAGGGSAMAGGTTSPSGGVTVLGGSTSSPGGTTTSAGGTTMASGGTTSLAGGTTAATGGAANATGGSTSSASGMAVTQYAWTRQWGTPGPYTWQEKWTATPDGTLTYRDMSKIEV